MKSMLNFLREMPEQEVKEYKYYISKFIVAMKVFSGLENGKADKESFYEELKQDVDKYIELMKKYIPDLHIPVELQDQAVRFFVIQEVNRVYSSRT